MRQIRYIPPGGALVEITQRTVQGRFLLPPTANFARIFTGILGQAQAREPVRIHAVVCMSNHYHLLATVDDARQMAEFMRYFAGNLAREASRLTGWHSAIFADRYRAILVSDEEAAQVSRLRYILGHGAKEGLVMSPNEWPGAHCAQALMEGEPLCGLWRDRTLEYEDRRQDRELDRDAYSTEHTILLEPLPCWRHLAPRTVRHRVRHLVQEIEVEAAQSFRQTGKPPAGINAIRRQAPHHRPDRIKRSPAPFVHAASRSAREAITEAYRLFIAAYRHATALLRTGVRNAPFPQGCFPPALPFVPYPTQERLPNPRAPG